MAASSRTPLYLALLLGSFALAGAVFVLLGDANSDRGGATSVSSLPADAALDVELPAPLEGGADASRLPPQERPPAPSASTLVEASWEGARHDLRGRFLRFADGSPLAGWSVRYAPPAPGVGARKSVSLDADGRFTLLGVPEVIDELIVESKGLRDPELSLVVALPVQPWSSELELVVDTGWVIAGRLRSSSGLPLKSAEIFDLSLDAASVQSAPPGRPDFFTGVRADGRFRLVDAWPRPVDDGVGSVLFPFEFAARAELHLQLDLTAELRDELRLVDDLDIVLEPSGAIEGRIVGADGIAAPWKAVALPLEITAQRVEPPRFELGTASKSRRRARVPGDVVSTEDRARSEQLTHYRVDHVPAGRYALLVTPALHSAGQALEDFLSNGPGLGLPADNLEAATLTPYGLPSESGVSATSLLEAQALNSERNADFAPPRLWIREVEVRAGEVTRLDLQLPWGGAFAGRVLDASGAAVPNATVKLTRELAWELAPQAERELSRMTVDPNATTVLHDMRPSGSRARAFLEVHPRTVPRRTDGAGGFSYGRLPAVELELRITPPEGSGLLGVTRSIQVRPGERSPNLDIVLPYGRMLDGRLTSATGRALQDGWVRVVRRGFEHAPEILAKTAPREGGHFRLEGLGEELYELQAGASDHATVVIDVVADDRYVELELPEGVTLKGQVIDAVSGAPVRDFSLELQTGGWIQSRAWATQSGRFSVAGLGLETLFLTVEAEGYEPQTLADIDPRVDLAGELEIRLTPSN